MPPDATSPAERKLLDDVRNVGWHVVGVASEDDSTGWAFSVGLFHNFQHPEVLLFGLTVDTMHTALNRIGNDVRVGQRFEGDSEGDGILEGRLCVFKQIDPRWYEPFMGYAIWFYGGDTTFPALQCAWSDGFRRYPWDAGFDPRWTELQPRLFHRDTASAAVAPWLRSMGLERAYP